MQGLSTPLVVAAASFLLIMLRRGRPALRGGGRRRASREALREARARIELAPDPAARALALCDAADLMASAVAGASGASGLYQRAMRTDPKSAVSVGRAVAGLANRPRALESLLWRPLAQGAFTADSREATHAVDRKRLSYGNMED